MKRSGTTIVFVLVCAIVLVSAYGVGVCVREYRFRKADAEAPVAADVQKTVARPAAQSLTKEPANVPPAPAEAPGGMPAPGGGPGFGGDRMASMRDRFANMSEEERQQAMAQMRERFGNRRRGGGENMPQLSEEDREKMRTEIEDLRNRWESMSEEERQEAQNQMREKYGFAPRFGGGSGGFGGGGFGGNDGGRRRPGGATDGGQQ